MIIVVPIERVRLRRRANFQRLLGRLADSVGIPDAPQRYAILTVESGHYRVACVRTEREVRDAVRTLVYAPAGLVGVYDLDAGEPVHPVVHVAVGLRRSDR